MLAIGGDYFGNAVNLAARLVAAAAPGQILAASDVRDELPDWPAIPQDPLILKGFDDPGDGLRPASVPLTDRLIAREHSKSRLPGPRRHRRLVAAQAQRPTRRC